MAEYVPPELQRVLDRMENIAGEHRTRLARLTAALQAERDRTPDPAQLQRAAEAEDAPAELRAVAAAVRAGHTSWEQCVAGKADHLPEVQALYAAVRQRLTDALELATESGDVQPTDPAASPPNASAAAGGGGDGADDDDVMVHGILSQVRPR